MLELTENTITYRYYNFNDASDPQLMVKTVPFGEMLVKENGKDKYSISLYLFDGTDEYELEMTGDLEEKIRQYPEFRKTLDLCLENLSAASGRQAHNQRRYQHLCAEEHQS